MAKNNIYLHIRCKWWYCIREWLNNEFYNHSFSEYQKATIKMTLVDNSLSTATYPGQHYYSCDDTNDNIFLMSYLDMKRTGYGFDSDDSMYDSARRRLTTDYTRSMETFFYAKDSEYYGNGIWWLRMPYYMNPNLTNIILYHGSDQQWMPFDTDKSGGIVPVLLIILD